MANVTPATIEFTPELGGIPQVIDFHAVMIEDHTTQAAITKYPVQTGTHITNHSIRNNRMVSITAMISNMRMVDPAGFVISGRDYGDGATKKVKEVMDSLIHSGQQCKVTTNLGIYNPVIFTKFKTSQKAGMVDSMELNITGEEIVVIDTENYVAPIPVIFKEATGPERAALVEELDKAGFSTTNCDKISTGSVNTDESFVIESVDAAGNPVSTTHTYAGKDPVTGASLYKVEVDGVEMYTDGEGNAIDFSQPVLPEDVPIEIPKASAMGNVGDCLAEEGERILTEQAEDALDTALGDLSKEARGIFYDTVSMDNETGQLLATAGAGCIIRGVTGNSSGGSYLPGESLPTAENLLEDTINLIKGGEDPANLGKTEDLLDQTLPSASDMLAGDIAPNAKTETLVQIESDKNCEDNKVADVDTTMVPTD